MLKNQVRIIGGKWRGRKLTFPDVDGLRPTLDRTRETLFNWLTPVIDDSRCLDLFAGSGALGFEALSRGASEVVFIDKDFKTITQLKENADKFGAQNATIIHSSADDYLDVAKEPFDIIFLDPPFHQDLILSSIEKLEKHKLVKQGGYIYIEVETLHATSLLQSLPENWQIKKQKRSGNVRYYLIEVA